MDMTFILINIIGVAFVIIGALYLYSTFKWWSDAIKEPTVFTITFKPKESPKEKSRDSDVTGFAEADESKHIIAESGSASSPFCNINYVAPPESADDDSWTWSSKHFE